MVEPPGPLSQALHRPFRPRRARQVAIGFAVAQGAVLAVIAALLPGAGPLAFRWYDRVGILLVAGVIAAVLLRLARVRALPDATGLDVRNVVGGAGWSGRRS